MQAPCTAPPGTRPHHPSNSPNSLYPIHSGAPDTTAAVGCGGGCLPRSAPEPTTARPLLGSPPAGGGGAYLGGHGLPKTMASGAGAPARRGRLFAGSPGSTTTSGRGGGARGRLPDLFIGTESRRGTLRGWAGGEDALQQESRPPLPTHALPGPEIATDRFPWIPKTYWCRSVTQGRSARTCGRWRSRWRSGGPRPTRAS